MPLPATSTSNPRALRAGRWIAGLAALVLLLLFAAWLTRRPLIGAAVTAGLQRAGAGDINFTVASASPWFVDVDDVAFRVQARRFAARRVTINRKHWWQSTLGAVRVEGARLPVEIDGSGVNPPVGPAAAGQVAAPAALSIPADELSVDGVLAIEAASLPEQPLALKFAAKQTVADTWAGTAKVTAPGLAVAGAFEGVLPERRFAFRVTSASLDLKVWQDFIQKMVVLPGGAWELAGRLTGTAEGTYAGGKLALGGRVKVEKGSFSSSARNVSATGVEADFDFTDLIHLQSKPGLLRVRELHSSNLTASDLDFELAFNGADRIDVSRATLRTLGGSLTAEPFTVKLDQGEIGATVMAEGLDMAEILALSKDIPAAAVGRVNGRLPILVGPAGVRFGTGWLELKSGVRAEVQLKAAGLLTSGLSPSSPSFAVLQKVETGMTRLHLTELRVDVRPPNAPPGRSAQVHIVGEPVDPGVKAPVTLDLNINGPLEQLLNLGLDKRVSFGSGK